MRDGHKFRLLTVKFCRNVELACLDYRRAYRFFCLFVYVLKLRHMQEVDFPADMTIIC